MILFHPGSIQGEEIEVRQAGSSEVKLQEYKDGCLAMVSGYALVGGIALAHYSFPEITLVVLGILGVVLLAGVIGVGRTVALLTGVFSFLVWLDRKDR